jgi:hypothetical protein
MKYEHSAITATVTGMPLTLPARGIAAMNGNLRGAPQFTPRLPVQQIRAAWTTLR